MTARRYHADATLPEPGAIFVFGSNLAGRHLGGAAKAAQERFGARPGVGAGLTGRAYAIPTKDARLKVLPLDRIAVAVAAFIEHARAHPDQAFFVTRVGCGLAGYDDADIAPLFVDAPGYCSFAHAWRPWLEASPPPLTPPLGDVGPA